jgi:hypothetical protein
MRRPTTGEQLSRAKAQNIGLLEYDGFDIADVNTY